MEKTPTIQNPVPPGQGQGHRGEAARFGRKHYISIGLTLFLVGFLVSFLCLPPPAEEHSENPPKENKLPQIAETPQALAAAAAAGLKRADALFQEGRLDAALIAYQTLDAASRSDLMQVRMAVCLERLGRWEQALAAFRYVASHADKQLRHQALVGQARVLIRLGQAIEARNLLYSFLLQIDGANTEVQADARYLLALALSFEALPRRPGQPLEATVVRPVLGPWKVRGFLEDSKTTASRQQLPKIVNVGKEGAFPEQKLLTAAMEQTPVKDVIENLAAVGGLEAVWSALALTQVSGRSTGLAVTNWPLLDVLQAVTGPLKLVGKVEGKSLRVFTESEVDSKVLSTHRAAIAQAALRNAILLYPRHALTPAAYLELGNFEESAEELPKALAWYERLAREWPRSPLRIEAWFNAGLIYRRQKETAQACKTLFQVVDHSPAHELTPLALLHIGELYMNEGKLSKALPALRRAVATSPGSKAHAAAVVMLGAAYLVEDNWQLANALLIEKRDVLAEKPYRPVGAFLDGYAMFRAARARRETRREGTSLLNSVLAFRKEKMLGLVGQYLLGKAFRDLEMWEETLRVFDTNKDISSPLVREMTFIKAEALMRLKKSDQVLPVLRSLADGKDKWSSEARYQLAAIALQQGQAQQCLQGCMQLWREQPPLDRPALLHLMGEAYDRLGQHDKAAQCFAGTPPG